jgi:UPF0176 protein
MSHNYQVLLFYCYSKIKDPVKFRRDHLRFCIENNIVGRIIISDEGNNGTISGKEIDCKSYINEIKRLKIFNDIDFKIDSVDSNVFKKINVRIKDEIVNSGIKNKKIIEKRGNYIKPSEFKSILEQQSEDVCILDVRSRYEYEIGKFKNAITLDIDNFREFPNVIDEIETKISKEKKIITYCTGGVKCEKASAFLKENGYKNVYQLHGGIIKYSIEEDGKDFNGKCYVFDNRIVKDINNINPNIIGECYVTGKKSDRMVNCANAECNKHIPLSDNGAKIYNGCCSEKCLKSDKVRKFDGTGFYQKKLNGYNPYQVLKH